jgi:aspartate racemase
LREISIDGDGGVLAMKKIGLVGGIGPESTLDYYRSIITEFRDSYETTGFPEIVIESIDLRNFNALVEAGKWEAVIQLLSIKCELLRRCGAEIGAMASNTPHAVFDAIQAKTDLPMVSIVAVTVEYARALGVKSLCLLGTRFTMTSDYYQDEFDKYNIRLTTPEPAEIERIQEILFREIELGVIKEKSRSEIVGIINRIRKSTGVEGVILGCTELPLILSQKDVAIHCINPSRIHIDALVKECRS